MSFTSQKTCRQCQQPFEITAEDKKLCQDFAPVIKGKSYVLPEPDMCHACRSQRRLAFRNERKIYSSTCDLCKKHIVSVYDPQKKLKVYCPDCFWGDGWDPTEYGREYDFSRTFFEQMKELQQAVPHLSNSVIRSVNCDFNSFGVDSKDCFQCVRLANSEKVLYSYLTRNSLECVDSHNSLSCQYCYECMDCQNCYNTKWSQICRDSSDLIMCYDCSGSRNCFGSFGLRNAEYYFFNQKYSQEEYEKLLQELDLTKKENILKAQEEFTKRLLAYPRRPNSNLNSENVVGDWITGSKNVFQGFEIEKCEDVAWSNGADLSKNIYDTNFAYQAEESYECVSAAGSTKVIFSFMPWLCHNVLYSMECWNDTHDSFGSISLRKKQYCILNKQYTKEEYEELLPRIIEHMQKTVAGGQEGGQWGRFFPPSLSLFGYNESIVSEYFPLERAEVERLGFSWWETENAGASAVKTVKAGDLPSTIAQVTDDILKTAIECEVTGRAFKIVKQELEFYQKHGIPLPHRHPDQRYLDRLKLRNPRKLYTRECAKCGAAIETTYAPDRPEIVYCEPCYLKAVY